MHIMDGVTYLDTREAAQRLGYNMRTLINHRCEDRSPMTYVKVLGRVLYPQSEVEAHARRLGR